MSHIVTSSRVVLRRGNDQVVTLSGLQSTQTSQYLNEATVVATLFDSKGRAIPAFTSVPMAYVEGSTGNYAWTIEADTLMLPANIELSLEIKAVQDSLNYRVVMPVTVQDANPS